MSVKASNKANEVFATFCMLFYTSKLPDSPHITTLIIFVSSLAHSGCSCFHRCTREARGQVQFSCFSFEFFVQQTIEQLEFDYNCNKNKVIQNPGLWHTQVHGQFKVHHRKAHFLPSPGLLFHTKSNLSSPQLSAHKKNLSHHKSTVGLLRLYHTLMSKLHKFLSGISLQVWKLKQMGSQEWCQRTRV